MGPSFCIPNNSDSESECEDLSDADLTAIVCAPLYTGYLALAERQN
jgi:hypothetical protein